MELDGLDKLLADLERMDEEIEKDVDTVVKNNTKEMTHLTLMNERSRFTKGYWTGHTARNTKTERVGSMHYKTVVGSEYAGYLNYGTRFMDATWFMRDSFNEQKKKFLADLDRLVE
ncbi:HK97-gp10 family putative phage morphogenesis protein [Sediminibacillus massiliensis]|uniref:HK97-gp10 family putative phage morphogenesis protein n=1 Tax=Sediminibacillus massiliensis TaxID=1926277 RepID=UPI0009887ADE|nr:HK97-gp10 family putative phage morphogenesis protein [Sediminibacillus massiliensis]